MCLARNSVEMTFDSDDLDDISQQQQHRRSTFATAAARLNILNAM